MSVRVGAGLVLVLLRLVLLWLSAAAAELVLIPAVWSDWFLSIEVGSYSFICVADDLSRV
jgi:hypothetical protein